MFISLLKKACRFFSAGFLRYFSFLFSTACVIVLDKKQIYMKLEVDGMNEARNATSVICSAYDSFFEAEKKIADFLEDIRRGKSSPLKNITSGYHYHEVTADNEETLDMIEHALKEKGFLVVQESLE